MINVLDSIKKFLAYSFGPVDWQYDRLTALEKKILSPAEFMAIEKWAIGNAMGRPWVGTVRANYVPDDCWFMPQSAVTSLVGPVLSTSLTDGVGRVKITYPGGTYECNMEDLIDIFDMARG